MFENTPYLTIPYEIYYCIMTNVVQCILAAWPKDGNNGQLVHKFGADIRGSQHF